MNLFSQVELKDSKFTMNNIKDISYYSVFNGKQNQPYSYNTTGDNVSRIYKNYVQAETSRFMAKTGKSPEQFLKEARLAQAIYEEQKDYLRDLEILDIQYKKTAGEARKAVNFIEETKRDTIRNQQALNDALASLERWQNTTQKYLDLMAEVDGTYALGHEKEFEVKGNKSPSGSPVGSLRLDSKAFTSYEKARLMERELAKALANLKGNVDKLPQTKLTTHQVSQGGFKKTSKGNKRQETIDLSTSISKMRGYISTIKGTIFEVAVASALEKQVSEIYDAVAMLGNTKGVKVIGSGQQFKTAKTDIGVKIKNKDINLSLKNQKHSDLGRFGTSALTSTTYKIIRITAQSDIDTLKMAGVFYTNPELRLNSKLNQFLAALVADFAISSGGSDRIDFMVYNDEIIPVGTYYANLSDRIHLAMGKDNKSRIFEILRGAADVSALNEKVQVSIR